jgi:hypothetical protein
MKKFFLILFIIVLVILVGTGLYALKFVNDFNNQIADGDSVNKIGFTDFFKEQLPDGLTVLVLPIEAEKGTTVNGKLYTTFLAKIDKVSQKVTTVELPPVSFVKGENSIQDYRAQIEKEYNVKIDKHIFYNLTALATADAAGGYGDNLFDFTQAFKDNLGGLAPYETADELLGNLGYFGTMKELTQSSQGLINLIGDNISTDLTVLELYAILDQLGTYPEDFIDMVDLNELSQYFK